MLFLFYFNFWVQWEKDLISFFTAFTIYIYQNKDKYIYFNNVLYNTIPYRFFPVYTYTEERQGIMKRSLSWSRIIKNENHRGAILWKKLSYNSMVDTILEIKLFFLIFATWPPYVFTIFFSSSLASLSLNIMIKRLLLNWGDTIEYCCTGTTQNNIVVLARHRWL